MKFKISIIFLYSTALGALSSEQVSDLVSRFERISVQPANHRRNQILDGIVLQVKKAAAQQKDLQHVLTQLHEARSHAVQELTHQVVTAENKTDDSSLMCNKIDQLKGVHDTKSVSTSIDVVSPTNPSQNQRDKMWHDVIASTVRK